jgi:hypothetical protein
MTDATITCPGCKAEIKLTESLAAPLLQAVKRDYERRLEQKDADVEQHKAALKEREALLAKEKAALDEQVAEKLRQARVGIAAEEARKAKLALGHDLEDKSRAIAELQQILEQRDAKLAEAQKVQAEFLRKQRELDDARREMEITIERRVQETLTAARDLAKKEAEEALKLKVLEKEQTIASMQKQLEELQRKAEQGSQQLQGEVLELQLEALLGARFSEDLLEPVPKGEHGGDLVHRVRATSGQSCGTILWESKRTKNWSDGWLVKLREDQRSAKADVAVLVSQALPKGVETFDLVEGVWVTHPRCVMPVAVALRQLLMDVACTRIASEGQQTKMEMVYRYLTGPRFRQRVQAIVEAFSSMNEDLDKEKKVIMKQWAKREEQIDRVMQATVGMYGDLQGIAGKSLQEVAGLEFLALQEPLFPEQESDGEQSSGG